MSPLYSCARKVTIGISLKSFIHWIFHMFFSQLFWNFRVIWYASRETHKEFFVCSLVAKFGFFFSLRLGLEPKQRESFDFKSRK